MKILIILFFVLSSLNLSAAPNTSVKTMMDEPVNLFDWGIYRMLKYRPSFADYMNNKNTIEMLLISYNNVSASEILLNASFAGIKLTDKDFEKISNEILNDIKKLEITWAQALHYKFNENQLVDILEVGIPFLERENIDINFTAEHCLALRKIVLFDLFKVAGIFSHPNVYSVNKKKLTSEIKKYFMHWGYSTTSLNQKTYEEFSDIFNLNILLDTKDKNFLEKNRFIVCEGKILEPNPNIKFGDRIFAGNYFDF